MPPLDSSTEEVSQENQQVVETQEIPAQDAQNSTTAESSAADEGDKSPKSLLDAVKAATAPKEGEAEPPAAEGGEGSKAEDKSKPDGQKAEGEEEELGEVTDEELRGYHSKTRRRVKQLLGRIEEKDKRIGDLTPKAEKFDQIVSYCQNAGLTNDEVNTLFGVGAALKSDPEKALEMIEPYYRALLTATGRVLPDDLRQDVETGRITEQRALELSQMRARNGLTQDQMRRQREEDQRRQEAEQRQKTTDEIGKAVTAWEHQQSASDPDYKLKQKRVAEKVQLAMMRGTLPKNAAEAVELAQKCKAEVEEELRAILPKRQAVREVTGGTSVNAAPPPASMLEAIKRAVGQ